MVDLEDDGHTTVPTVLDNPRWGNTPPFEWRFPEEFQDAFTLRGQQAAVLHGLQEIPWPTKTLHSSVLWALPQSNNGSVH